MEEIIIELSSYNCLTQNTSSDYVCKLSKPITINEGDTIVVRNAFLDTRLISNQFINFDTDQNITMVFYYYSMYTGYQQGYFKDYNQDGENELVIGDTPDDGDNLPYVLKGWTQQGITSPITSQISFTIPAGIYTCDNLAALMSREMQKCNEINNVSILNATFGYYGPTANNNVRIETALTNLYLEKWSGDYYKLYVGGVRGNDFYSEAVLVPLLNATDLSTRGSNGYNRNFITSYYQTGFQTLYGGFVGASEFSVQYNNENSGKFEFTYTHTPLIDATSGKEVVCFRQQVNNGLVKYTFNNRLTGILFQSLEPRSFWEQLGFDIDSMTFTSSQVMNRQITLDQFDKATTKNYMAYQNMYGNTGFKIKDTDGKDEAQLQLTSQFQIAYPVNVYYDSDKTTPILAVNPPISSNTNAGHYLIEIKEYESEYINNDKEYRIKGLIPTYYLSQDSFATSYEDTLQYIHNGQSMTLNKMSVRILNPITKEPANLGNNNTIYLQVLKNPPIEVSEKPNNTK
jgi:hypothetical protein